MAHYTNALRSEDTLDRGIIVDAKQLFNREEYEERLERELGVLIRTFERNHTVDMRKLRDVYERFINDVSKALQELEHAKRNEEGVIDAQIRRVQSLLALGKDIRLRDLLAELEHFGKILAREEVRDLRRFKRKERRLRKGKMPRGYILKKLRSERGLLLQLGRKAELDRLNAESIPREEEQIKVAIARLKKDKSRRVAVELKHALKSTFEGIQSNVDNFTAIVADIEIEEARKLHRIDHYIVFLNVIEKGRETVRGTLDLEEVKKLRRLLEDQRRRATDYVYQDSVDAKRLLKLAKQMTYGERVLKTAERTLQEDAFDDVIQEEIRIPMSAGPPIVAYILYPGRKEGEMKIPALEGVNRGIVMAHGFYSGKHTSIILAKRLAAYGFMVISMDLTASGDDRRALRIGTNSEYLIQSTKYLRNVGVKGHTVRFVGSIGQSLGCHAVMYSIAGYTLDIERQFFELAHALGTKIQEIDGIRERVDKEKNADRRRELLASLGPEMQDVADSYAKIRKLIFSGIEAAYSGGRSGIPDAVVLTSPVRDAQAGYGGKAKQVNRFVGWSRFWSRIYSRVLPRAVMFVVNRHLRKTEQFVDSTRKEIYQYEIGGEEHRDAYKMFNLYVEDAVDAIRYMANMKDPHEYLEWLLKLEAREERTDKKGFFSYYIEFIRKIPKLYIYGTNDSVFDMFKPGDGNSLTELENYYEQFGADKILRFWNVVHSLNVEGDEFADWESHRLPKVTKEILHFLDMKLPRAQPLPSSKAA